MDIIFKTLPVFKLENDIEVINQIKLNLVKELGVSIKEIKKINVGQNINYKININSKDYLLRIISRKGYPSIETLKLTYTLLNDNFKTPKILYSDISDKVVPYGYFIQEWLDGDNYSNDDWLYKFVEEIKKVHVIKTQYFGYHNGPNFKTINEYFYNMDKVIDNSFGDIFVRDFSIWDLEKIGITTKNFLSDTFNKIKKLSLKIQSNVESVLLHGDMLPGNLIKSQDGFSLIDWDESRAGWWVYDLARTLYYIDIDINSFLDKYKTDTPINDIEIGIKLEHIRQLLRTMCIKSFNTTDINKTKLEIKEIEILINEKFRSSIIKKRD